MNLTKFLRAMCSVNGIEKFKMAAIKTEILIDRCVFHFKVETKFEMLKPCFRGRAPFDLTANNVRRKRKSEIGGQDGG